MTSYMPRSINHIIPNGIKQFLPVFLSFLCLNVVPIISTGQGCDSFNIRTNSGILQESINSWSASWGDYDNDGYDDLFIPENDMTKPNKLYHNNGDGTFTRITTGEIVNDLSSSVMGKWGDYNNDGFLDLFVSSNVMPQNLFYENNGDGTFTKITQSSLIEMGAAILDADWTDYNRDGFLDIIATDYNTNSPNHLYRGDGKGNFTLDSHNIISRSRTTAVGTAWCDYDQDGDIDLFITNTHGQNNQLFKNDNGQFVEIRTGSIVNDGGHSVDCAWGDMDNDGDMDLYVVNSRTFEKNNLYRNEGNGTFTKIINSPLVNYPANSNEAEWVDFNNDGYLDLYVANDQDQENHLFINSENQVFTKADNVITKDTNDSYGCSWADVDRDGDLDLYVPNTFLTQNDFYQNKTEVCTNNKFIDIKLIGCTSNSFGLGSQIRLLCTINGKRMWQTKDVDFNNTGSSTHFGLGDAVQIDSIIVFWPSGLLTIATDLTSLNTSISFKEDCQMKIEGHVFWDINNNGIKDQNEGGVPNHRIIITPGNFWTYTDSAGNYATYVEAGTYSVSQSHSDGSPVFQTFPTDYQSYQVTLDPQINYLETDIDFGVSDRCVKPDLEIAISSSVLNREKHSDYDISIYNNSKYTAAKEFEVEIKITNNASLTNENLEDFRTDSLFNYYRYKIAGLGTEETTSFHVKDEVLNAAAKQDTILVWVNLIYNYPECEIEDNKDSIYTITNDIKDNEKLVTVNRVKGATEGLHTYTIIYQNIGLEPATYLKIIDTLSPYLDANTFEVISTTHDFQVSRSDHRITWIADKIYLPTKGESAELSKGEIVFSIYPREDVKKKNDISNTAYITFGRNLPVKTNTVVTNYQYNDGHIVIKDVVLSPNPNSGIFEVKIETEKEFLEEIAEVEIIDSRGRIVHKYIPTEVTQEIDITYMPAAVYILKVTDSYGEIRYKKFIKS